MPRVATKTQKTPKIPVVTQKTKKTRAKKLDEKQEPIDTRAYVTIDDNYRVAVTSQCLILQQKIDKEAIEAELASEEALDDKADAVTGWGLARYYTTWAGVMREMVKIYSTKKLKSFPQQTAPLNEMIRLYDESWIEMKKMLGRYM